MGDTAESGDQVLNHAFSDRSTSGLTEELAFLIRSGALPIGSRLPAIRDLATRLNLSPALIANVWSRLRTAGLISTHRRGGSFVGGSERAKSKDITAASSLPIDLSSSVSDRRLVPALGPAFAYAVSRDHLHDPRPEDITQELREAALLNWPYVPEEMMAMGDGPEAEMLVLTSFAQPSDLVAVEEPCNPRILNDIRRMAFQPVGIASDAHGPLPESLDAILKAGAKLVVLQPQTNIPIGRSISRKRLSQLADIVAAQGHSVVVYEDDNYGILSRTRASSLGEFIPDHVLLLRSYSKPFGFDMKVSVLGGASALMNQVRQRRALSGRTSRVLQDALAYLLSTPEYTRHAARACDVYFERMEQFHAAARRYEINVVSDLAGLTACIAVSDEQATLLELATQGYLLGAGSQCTLLETTPPFVRVGIGNLAREQILPFMEILARAVHRGQPEIQA